MYAYNPQAASSADDDSLFIRRTGKYIGQFTRAQHITSTQTGTKGIDFDFLSTDGQKARFALYTIKADGTQLLGFRQLMAMMTVLNLKALAQPVRMPTKVWNFDTRREETQPLEQFTELLNKLIGVLLEMEEYEPRNATTTKWRPVLAGIFQARTELTASEIIAGQTQPLKLTEKVVRLKDRPVKHNGAFATPSVPTLTPAYQAAPANLADMTDDIPF